MNTLLWPACSNARYRVTYHKNSGTDSVSRPFLADITARKLAIKLPPSLTPESLFVGNDPTNLALEVAVVSSPRRPSNQDITKTWRTRRAGRATPVLLIAIYGDKACLCGVSGDHPAILDDVDVGQAERLARAALALPDRLSAQRFVAEALPSLETNLPGITNAGMLALHNLTTSAPARADWGAAGENARKAAVKAGESMLSALGYSVERLDNLTKVLRSSDKRTALAVLLNEDESIESGSPRFNSMSPISYAMSKADDENLTWIVIVKGNRIRLYSNEPGKGVGRRGRTETYIECQPSLLAEDDLGYLWMLFSAAALSKGGSLDELLSSSARFAGDLATRLRDRIYEHVVPNLAQGIVRARNLENPTPKDLDLTYQMALTVLFRLLFIAYAEDRDLLPFRQNDAYRSRSLTEKAKELSKSVAENRPLGNGDNYWVECEQLFDAVAEGNTGWSVPQYGGDIFLTDPVIAPAGAALKALSIRNEYFETALRALLVATDEGTTGPVDFRSLGVREFGTIYEGLLEAELSVAEVDLKLDKKATYIPTREGEVAAVRAGEVYLHNKSGSRKSSGSYYTKHFAVEYLLDGSLEPALDEHFSRLDAMKSDVDAAEALFDFRVADIAMGSGHFLVAAIDRIEARIANYLKQRQEKGRALSAVIQELAELRKAAHSALGELKDDFDIEDGQLLRRQIARRCIYGVDLNPLAVQLARLSIWIHTFVPGLPLSLLDHNLVLGNALVGVGTLDDIKKKFDGASGTLFEVDADELLGEAAKPLRRLATLNDATPADIELARKAIEEAKQAILPTKALCDLITAQPISTHDKVRAFQFENWEGEKKSILLSLEWKEATEDLAGLDAFHFPIQFPEIFLGDNPGFDVILGNPPWQEATLEKLAFWARHFPGLRGLGSREQKAKLLELEEERPDLNSIYQAELKEVGRIRGYLTSGVYQGMGTGDPDVYKAFCWRFWNLTRVENGCLGVVLPRSALAAQGTELFRKALFSSSKLTQVTMLLNRKQWVFEDLHPQWTIGLITAIHGQVGGQSIGLRGPYPDLVSFEAGKKEPFSEFSAEDILAWNESASLPLFPAPDSIEVFRKLRESPWLSDKLASDWRARPDRELDATNDKHFFDFEHEKCPEGYWPVFKGESFDIWNPDRGIYFGWADPGPVKRRLYDKRLNSARSARDSAHSEFSIDYVQREETLACNKARIVIRDVTRSTDSRTVRACLIPPHVFVTNKAPYLLWSKGDELDQAFLLGVLSSIPLDWYARRFVEINLNFFIFNPFPIPRPKKSSPLRKKVIKLAGRLACPDERFADWAVAVGVDCKPLKEDVKNDMIDELDAVVAHLYGLSKRQLTHVFETFHEGWDYQPRLGAVLEHYDAWANKA